MYGVALVVDACLLVSMFLVLLVGAVCFVCCLLLARFDILFVCRPLLLLHVFGSPASFCFALCAWLLLSCLAVLAALVSTSFRLRCFVFCLRVRCFACLKGFALLAFLSLFAVVCCVFGFDACCFVAAFCLSVVVCLGLLDDRVICFSVVSFSGSVFCRLFACVFCVIVFGFASIFVALSILV